MKSHHQPPSRLYCRFVRLISSWSGVPPARHLVRCPGCREYFVGEARVEAALRRGARQASAPAPAGLEDRILGAIPYSTATQQRPAARRHRPWLWSLAGAAAVAVFALVVLQSPSDAPVMVEDDSSRKDEPAVVQVNTPNTLEAWRERLTNLSPSNPLEQEIDAVYSDTRSALRFLARNFLPREPEILIPPEQRRT